MTDAPKIDNLPDLHQYLHAAMMLEHGTIPPYLTALYSIHPGTNSDGYHVIRVVAVEEMLHLTLAANLLNAVGGTPDLTVPGFVPDYPTYLPDGETDFKVGRMPFSPECIEMFLHIERPGTAPDEASRTVEREHPPAAPGALPGNEHMRYWSIGEFYAEIERGLRHLDSQGEELFTGDPAKQVGPEYYYSGGGEVIPVTDLESALAAMELIAEQGEGLGGHIHDAEKELAHYYRFEQLLKGRYYLSGDEAGNPTGPPLEVDWDAVHPIKANARIEDYPDGSDLRAAAEDFNRRYADFLALLTRAYGGQPELLTDAVVGMFRLRDDMVRLMHTPIPGMPGVHAAPTFEVSSVVPA